MKREDWERAFDPEDDLPPTREEALALAAVAAELAAELMRRGE